MAIASVTGTTVSNAVAGASVNAPAINVAAASTVFVAVALANTASAVTSITDTAGNTYTLQSGVTFSTTVRVELWAATNATANAADVIVVNVAPNSLLAVAIETYSGAVSAYIGNTATASATSWAPEVKAVTQDGGNWNIAALGFACTSGDTFTAWEGTIRQSIVPALTSVGVALVDNTNLGNGTIPCGVTLSALRDWAAATAELRTHATVVIYQGYVGLLPAGAYLDPFANPVTFNGVGYVMPLKEAAGDTAGNVAY